MGKRKLSFNSLEEAADEIRRLRDAGYTQLGAWNLTQCCEHLDKTMTAGMEGSIKPMPWILRATILRALTEYVLATGWMPSGAKTLRVLVPTERAEDDPAVIDACLATTARAAGFSAPLPTYAISTGMTVPKWRRLMGIHAAHHLGNLQPIGGEG